MENKIIEFLKEGVVIIVAIAVVGVGGQIIKEIFFQSKPSQENNNQKLTSSFQIAANQLNAQGPIMIDGDVRRDKAIAGPGPAITYYMSTPKISSASLYSAGYEIRNELTKSVCSNEKMKPSLKHGASYNYVYSGSDNVEAFRISISSIDCK